MAKTPARYDLRQDSEGWTVFDIWTGEAAVIHFVPQTGLEIQDADELAELLTWLADRGDRSILQ
jgi:hypothetical protein